jgi:hypothetical protein
MADETEVDRSKRCMLSGAKETPGHRKIDPRTGMQKDYVVLCPNERAKGFVRPVRQTYRHLPCNTTTHMGLALAETYARDPWILQRDILLLLQDTLPARPICLGGNR